MNIEKKSSKRRFVLLGAGLAAGLMGAGVATWQKLIPSSPKESALAELLAWEGNLPNGEIFKMSTLRGKPILLNFWATWCPPCIEELPLLNAFIRDYASKSWQIVGISADKESAVKSFLSKQPLLFPTPLAGFAGIELSRQLGNTGGGLPFSVVLNAHFEIVHRKIGALTAQELENIAKMA